MQKEVLDKNKLVIRLATSSDTHHIVRINIQGWQQAYKNIIDQGYLDSLPSTFEDKSRMRQECLSKEDGVIHLVAEYEGKIIGFCDAGPVRNYVGAKGEIYTIYVLQEYHTLGVGKALWNEAVEFLTTNGLIPFTILTLKDNLPARKFYEKLGASEIATESWNLAGKTYQDVRYIVGL